MGDTRDADGTPRTPRGPRPARTGGAAARTTAPRTTPRTTPRTAAAPRAATPRTTPPRTTPRTTDPRTTTDPARTRAGASHPRDGVPTQRTTSRPLPAERPRVRRAPEPAPRPAAPRVITLPPARTGTPQRRQTVLLGLALTLLVVFTGRLVYVQGLEGPAIAEVAMSERMKTVTIAGDRGRILDRDGDVLATSVERYNVVVNQEQFGAGVGDEPGALEQEALDAATELGALLGADPQALALKLIGTDKFVYLSKGVTPEVYRHVRDLGIAGITGERTTDRVYPEGTTGGNIVGFVGAEGFGQAGLEQVFDETLTGTPGSETYEQGARGQRIPGGLVESVPAVPGQDVRLTIDRDLQHMAQQALDEQVARTGASWGVVEVVDVRTGEILVLADSGTTDPNAPTSAAASRAVAAVYEPGSTAKVVAVAAALESGIATPTSQYTVPYQYTVANGQTFKDSHEHPDQQLTLTGILAQSSNTGTVMVGQHLPPQVRHDYLTKFGFGTKTGIGLPGESRGLLQAAEDWDGRTAYAVLFGQGVGATTLQSTQVFATLANGGVRVQPHVVAGTYDADGTFHETPTEPPVQVVSPETAAAVMSMLESAVAEGTGSNAAVPGYRVAGKTGTAQAWEAGGVQKIVGSFVGVAPADDPRLAINVALYDPKSSIYGGDVAAPVFSEVTAHALRSLGIPPSGTTPELYPTTWE